MKKKTERKIMNEMRKLKKFKESLLSIRDLVELNEFSSEDIYPLDTFRYKPEIIEELLIEINDCLESLTHELELVC